MKSWQLDEVDIAGMFVGYLNINQGSICVFPDAGGPWPRSIEYTDSNLWSSLPKENNHHLPMEQLLSSDSYEDPFPTDKILS